MPINFHSWRVRGQGTPRMVTKEKGIKKARANGFRQVNAEDQSAPILYE